MTLNTVKPKNIIVSNSTGTSDYTSFLMFNAAVILVENELVAAHNDAERFLKYPTAHFRAILRMSKWPGTVVFFSEKK